MDDFEQLAALLKVMAHPVRLNILNMLRSGEVCVCHMEKALGKRQAYVSQQLMTLRKAGLVTSRPAGVHSYYRLIDPRVTDVLEAICEPFAFTDHQAREDCHCAICESIRMRQARDCCCD
jgi:DNA-binding transcriptional ArsR family regulator